MKKPLLTNILLALLLPWVATPLLATPIRSRDNTIVDRNGDIFNISGGNLSGDSANLFHSFEAFGLDTGQVANFLSAPNIQNILGRVTGGDPSIINGLIQVTGGNSNLFLMNPAGIVFGANASLNIPGDFTATTATGIGFGNNWFNAFGENNYYNLIGNPNQFAFDLKQHGRIINNGNLAVSAGNALTFIGGSVTNNGTLTAPNGRITIASIPGTNRVKISHQDALLSLEIDAERIPENGEIRAIDLPEMLTGEEGTTIANGTISTAGTVGGEINILGDRVILENALIDVSGIDGGGTIRIGGGERGEENIPNALETYIGEGVTILANALETGNGGRVIVWADDTTTFLGDIYSEGGLLGGDGGFIEVSGKQILDFRGFASTAPNSVNGDYGLLFLDPENFSIYSIADTLDIVGINNLLGTSYLISDFSPIFKEVLEASASPIILEASQNIIFDIPDLILSTPHPVQFTAGQTIASLHPNLTLSTASELTLTADRIHLPQTTLSTDNALLSITATNGDLFTGSLSTSGGNLTLQAPNGSISTGIANTSPPLLPFVTADAGEISVLAGGNIEIDRILASGTKFGDGGNVTLNAAGNISLALGSDSTGWRAGNFSGITGGDFTSTAQVVTIGYLQAGSVFVQANGSIENSDFRLATGAAGNNPGGNLTLIAGGDLEIGNASTSSSNGPAGNMTFTANGTIATGSLIARGTGGGDIAIASFDNILIDGIARAEGDIAIATHNNLTVTGILFPGERSIEGLTVQITTGTPLEIATGTLGTGSTIAGAIYTGPSPIANLTLSTDTTLPNFQYTRIANASPTPASPASAIALAEASNWAEGIGQTLGEALTTTTTPEAEIWGWGPVSLAFPLSPSSHSSPAPIPNTSEGSAIATAPTTRPNIAEIERQLTEEYRQYLGEYLEVYEEYNEQKILEKLEQIEAQIGKKFAIYYVLPSQNGLDLILFMPGRDPIYKQSIITPEQLKNNVLEYLNLLQIIDDTNSYELASKELYEKIMSPVERELEENRINAIAFVLGEGLRRLPIGTLWDGEQYLIENYAVGTLPSLSLTNPEYVRLQNQQVLGVGVSEFSLSDDLPAVKTELESISNTFEDARILLDEQATFENFSNALNDTEIVHIATHAVFTEQLKYIHFWDKKATPEDINQLNLNPLELIVLSACETGVGEPELGFAGLALWLGSRSAVASPLMVADASTQKLMSFYYQNLNNSSIETRVEALQLAQLKMMEEHDRAFFWGTFMAIGTPW